jgi:hypothetical protein
MFDDAETGTPDDTFGEMVGSYKEKFHLGKGLYMYILDGPPSVVLKAFQFKGTKMVDNKSLTYYELN